MDLDELLENFLQIDGDEFVFDLRRETLQEGRSFSPEAMDQINVAIATFIGSRLMRRWDRTGEPPTYMAVKVVVDVG